MCYLSLKQLAPPPINEEDARKGILSLIERGLIPPAAQLTLDPSPVRNKIVPLHNPEEKIKPPCTPGKLPHDIVTCILLILTYSQVSISRTRYLEFCET